MGVIASIASLMISAGIGALWRIDKRQSVIEANIERVLEQVLALRTQHKERLDDHETRIRLLEKIDRLTV